MTSAGKGWLLALAALLAGGIGLITAAVFGAGRLQDSPLGRQLGALVSDILAVGPADPPGLYIADPGEAAPRLNLPRLDGRLHPLPIAGRPVLINYWASWCGPCREEMPLLAAFSRDQGAIEVVGVALDTAEDAGDFLAEHPVPFSILVEAPGQRDSSVQLGNRRGLLPYSVLVGADGRVLARRTGAFDDAEDLRDWASIVKP